MSALTRQGVRNLSPHRNGMRKGKPRFWGVCEHDWTWRYDEHGAEWQECSRCYRTPREVGDDTIDRMRARRKFRIGAVGR